MKMFENVYPYTDFHEMNLDWFLENFQKLQGEWNQIKPYIPEIDAPYVVPEMFGAKGDGLTDDSIAIQDAINTGKAVYLSDKTYLCKTGITLTDSLNIIGSGADKTILIANFISNDARYVNMSNMRCQNYDAEPFLKGQITLHRYSNIMFTGSLIFELTGEVLFPYFDNIRVHTCNKFIKVNAGNFVTDTWTFIGCSFYKVNCVFYNEALLYDLTFTRCAFETSEDIRSDVIYTFSGSILTFDSCYFENVNALETDNDSTTANINLVDFNNCFIASSSTVYRSYNATVYSPAISFVITNSRINRSSQIFIFNRNTCGSISIKCSNNSYLLNQFKDYIDTDSYSTVNYFIGNSNIDIPIMKEIVNNIEIKVFYHFGLDLKFKGTNLNKAMTGYFELDITSGSFLPDIDRLYTAQSQMTKDGDNTYNTIYIRIMGTRKLRFITGYPCTLINIYSN